MWQLFPDVEPRKPRARPQKSPARVRHETLLGATVATLSFAVFQVVELRDSMSAQISTVVILFALHYPDTIHTAHKRALGTLLGSALAVAMQLVLYSHAGNLLLVMIALWCGLMLFARAHVLEGGASGIGFCGLTTMGILFGQYVAPDQDLVYSALYRISSVLVALVCGLAVTALVHRLLNCLEPTRTDAPS
ncbi:FUSC family protein [Microbulbifer halophilus]|uniref:FUSC family protein n=1 Tax=Microbulbifer halophilus TaxID=453963 RepID=A0ABW5EG43_9GAMM|nr:FUSC family protein [Microbulbifer halophilus]MCW8127222.1 FUSC family protein [Microbulbifer halophilus]